MKGNCSRIIYRAEKFLSNDEHIFELCLSQLVLSHVLHNVNLNCFAVVPTEKVSLFCLRGIYVPCLNGVD